MRVTLAVPSRNYARFLPACLESIRAQDHGDLEVLIADGGSTDSSPEIIDRFVREDARFRLVSTTDGGQADAVRRCLSAASGDVLGYLNADDVFLRPDALSLAVRAFREDAGVDIVSFGGTYIDDSGAAIRPVNLRHHPLDRLEWLRFRSSVLQPATFWRRRVGEAIPFRVDLHYVFDAWFFFEAHERFRWAEHDDRIAGYRLHGGNKSAGIRADRVEELARFEAFKFGDGSLRAAYLRRLAKLLRAADRAPLVARPLKRAVYGAANALSYASAYRIPGI